MNSPVDALQSTDPASPSFSTAPRQLGIWSGAGTVLLYFALQFAVALVSGVLFGIAFGFWKGFAASLHHQRVDPAAIANALNGNPDVRVGLAIVALGGTAALMMWIVHRRWPALWSVAKPPGFGFITPPRKAHILYAVPAALAVLVVGSGLTALLAHGHPLHQDVKAMANSTSPGLRILLMAVTICVIPPVEELVFRGVFLSGLLQRVRAGWAILISALVFGCIHLPDFKFSWAPVPALVLLGILLAWLRIRTRSLWPSITAHATNNLAAALMWLLLPHLHP